MMGPTYFTSVQENGMELPFTGNVPLIQSTESLPVVPNRIDFINPYVVTFGSATGVSRDALMTSLSGIISNTALETYLNGAELRGINPSLPYYSTFDPSLTSLAQPRIMPQNIYPF